MSIPETPVDYVDLSSVAADLGIDDKLGAGAIITLSDAAAATMSCCDKTDALCWTQM